MIQSLLKLVMLCGKQGLNLRSHDSKARNENTLSFEGNFISLVQFCVETDLVLAEHLTKAPRNAQIENHLKWKGQSDWYKHSQWTLDGSEQGKVFLSNCRDVRDIPNKEELSMSLHYIFDGFICEVFMDFIDVERLMVKL